MAASSLGCDDGGTARLAPDQAVGTGDAGGDGAVARDGGEADGGLPDAGPTLDLAVPPDVGPDQGAADGAAGCAQAPSERPAEGLRLVACRWELGGLEAPPRAVVLATDSLARASRTPLHEPEHLTQLAAAGVGSVWLLTFWDGIEPQPGTFNGAYMGRVCDLARAAADAGLSVVLALYFQGFGAGGVGAPVWAGDGWDAFLAGEGRAFEPAWSRLLDTCADAPVDGLAFVGVPARPVEGARAFMTWVEAAAEARFGPLLSFWPPGTLGSPREADRAPVQLLAPVPGGGRPQPLTGVGAGLVGAPSPDGLRDVLRVAAGVGWTPVVWADGFGGPFSLRDALGAPGPAWVAALDSPWPAAVAGELASWGHEADGWWARWVPDARNEGVSRFTVQGPDPVGVEVTADPPVAAFGSYDPVAREITVYVAPGAQAAALRVSWEGE